VGLEFGSINLQAQIVMSGALAFLIFGGRLTVVAIDHPFAGTVKLPMSALGQKQTFRGVRAMCALPPESGH
jgi:hypothetical protein